MFAAVVVRLKRHALLFNFAELGKTIHLKPARVGQHTAAPIHKLMDAAHVLQDFCRRAQIQVVRVGKQTLCPGVFQIFARECFDTRLRGYGHKYGRMHRAVAGV